MVNACVNKMCTARNVQNANQDILDSLIAKVSQTISPIIFQFDTILAPDVSNPKTKSGNMLSGIDILQ